MDFDNLHYTKIKTAKKVKGGKQADATNKAYNL